MLKSKLRIASQVISYIWRCDRSEALQVAALPPYKQRTRRTLGPRDHGALQCQLVIQDQLGVNREDVCRCMWVTYKTMQWKSTDRTVHFSGRSKEIHQQSFSPEPIAAACYNSLANFGNNWHLWIICIHLQPTGVRFVDSGGSRSPCSALRLRICYRRRSQQQNYNWPGAHPGDPGDPGDPIPMAIRHPAMRGI